MKRVGVNELARHLATTREGIARLVEAQVIERRADGKYDLDKCRVAYLTHLRARPARGGSSNRALLDARTRLTNIRIAEQQHRLADVAETTAALDQFAGWVIVTFEALPGAIARARADRALRAELQRWVFDSRTALADRCAAEAASLQQSGTASDAWAQP